MLLKKNIFISSAFILMSLGCQSTNQNDTDNGVETETSTVTKRPVVEIPEEENPVAQEESKPSNWYIRIVAEDPSRSLKTNSAQLGTLEATDAVVKHTLISNGRFTGPYLDVVFVDPDGVPAGAYKTNYHMHEEGVEDRWRFTVQTNDTAAEILLTWDGLYTLTPYIDDKNREQYKEYRSLTNPLIDHMKLVDVETGKEIAASSDGKVQTYVFNMDGLNEREFEWVVKNEVVNLPLPKGNALTLKANNIQKDEETVITKKSVQRAELFDLSKPPVFMD